MEALLEVIIEMGDKEAAIKALLQCENEKNFSLGLFLSQKFLEFFPKNITISMFYSSFLFNLKRYESCFDFIEEQLLPLKNIDSEKLKLILKIQAACIPHIENRYIQYNEKLSNKLYNKQKGKITFTITTCKRLDLFKKTINSFLNCCTDIKKIDRWFCVDDNSSDEDRKEMQRLYPFFEFYFKTPDEKGHAKSMNIILQNVKTPYMFHMEDDWQFFAKKPYISICLEILQNNNNYGQCLINKNYAEVGEDMRILGGIYSQTESGLRYVIHEHTKNQQEFDAKHGMGFSCAYWPHYSLRPSLLKTSILKSIGNYNYDSNHFEKEFAERYCDKGFLSVFLEGIYSRHIGRLTSEINTDKQNAYQLNNESQFVKPQPEPEKIPETISEFPEKIIPTFVINLDRRQDRWNSFTKNNSLKNYERFSAIDGSKIKDSIQLQRIFDGNDYDMKHGMVGCALSHIKLWIEMLELKEEIFCVLEDDATVTENFNKKLQVLLKEPISYDICFLGYHIWKHNETEEITNKNKNPEIRKCNAKEALDFSMGGTSGYLITKSGARKMLEFICKKGMRNCIDTMMQKAGDTLELYYSIPQLVFSPCPSFGNVDSDIQHNYNSLSVSTDLKHEREIKYLLTISNVGRIPSKEIIDQFIRAGAIKDSILFYTGTTAEITELSKECIYPHYTIDDKNIYIITKSTDKIINDRWVFRLKDKDNNFSLKGIEIEENVNNENKIHINKYIPEKIEPEKLIIPFGDCSHTFEAVNLIFNEKSLKIQYMFPFDIMEGANFKTCALLTEHILGLNNKEIEEFVTELCDKNKNTVNYHSWNKKYTLENNKYKISFPHDDVDTLVKTYTVKFINLKNAIHSPKHIVLINCARWKNLEVSEYYHLYDLLQKYNKNVSFFVINGITDKIEGGRKITTESVEFPQNFRNDEWPAEKIVYDQKHFRVNIISPIRKFLN